jgi:hypothetical protein
MKDIDYLIATYRMLGGMMQGHLADFSDADMLVRPVLGANHVAWQLGHLCTSTTNCINMCTPGAMPELSPDFLAKYNKESSKKDSGFDSKDELLKRFGQVNDSAIAWLQKLSDADKATATPDKLKGFSPTVGGLAHALAGHGMMHIGQIQVARRKLGKPVLF